MALTEAEQREKDQRRLDELRLKALEDKASSAGPNDDGGNTVEQIFNYMDLERAPVTAAIAKTLGLERPDDPSFEEVKSLKKTYPTTSDLLERAGILTEDPYYSRSALGLVGDTLSSPSTYATAGYSALAKHGSKIGKYGPMVLKALEAAAAPVSVASDLGMDKAGKYLWKKGFSKMDAAAMKAGKEVVPSDVLMGEGIFGFTSKGIGDKIDASQAARMNKRDAILNMGIAPGKRADIDAVLYPMEEHGRELLGSVQPDVQRQGEAILEEARLLRENILGTPDKIIPGSPSQTIKGSQDLATGAYSPDIIIPEGVPKLVQGKPKQYMTPKRFQKEKVFARDKLSQADFLNKPMLGKQSDVLLSHGFQKEAEKLSYDPEAIAKLNSQWGAIFEGRKPQMSDIAKEMTSSSIDPGDMASAATYAMMTGKISPWMMARNVGDAAGLGAISSGLGALAHKTGTKVLPKAAKRIVGRTPWALLKPEHYEEINLEELE